VAAVQVYDWETHGQVEQEDRVSEAIVLVGLVSCPVWSEQPRKNSGLVNDQGKASYGRQDNNYKVKKAHLVSGAG
jgi:hypothetical protein